MHCGLSKYYKCRQKKTVGYIGEHSTDDGDYEIWVKLYQHSEELVRRQIQSGHKSQTNNVWMRIDIQDKNDPVKNYYIWLISSQYNHYHRSNVLSLRRFYTTKDWASTNRA